MTFEARELSADQGRPVEFLTFARGTQVWRYTTADRDMVLDGNAYLAAPIRRSQIEQGPEINRAGLKLTMPFDLEVAALYHVAPPSDAVVLTLRQQHADDAEVVVLWSGRIVGVNFMGGSAEMSLEPSAASMKRSGLRRLYQSLCPHVLYGPRCKVVASTMQVAGTVASVGAIAVQVAAAAGQPDGYFEGGFIEWEAQPGIYERRFIFGHVGAALELDATPAGLLVGAAVSLYPGCDHSLATCAAKFDNALNYGGQPFTPRKNPFGQNPVY